MKKSIGKKIGFVITLALSSVGVCFSASNARQHLDNKSVDRRIKVKDLILHIEKWGKIRLKSMNNLPEGISDQLYHSYISNKGVFWNSKSLGIDLISESEMNAINERFFVAIRKLKEMNKLYGIKEFADSKLAKEYETRIEWKLDLFGKTIKAEPSDVRLATEALLDGIDSFDQFLAKNDEVLLDNDRMMIARAIKDGGTRNLTLKVKDSSIRALLNDAGNRITRFGKSYDEQVKNYILGILRGNTTTPKSGVTNAKDFYRPPTYVDPNESKFYYDTRNGVTIKVTNLDGVWTITYRSTKKSGEELKVTELFSLMKIMNGDGVSSKW